LGPLGSEYQPKPSYITQNKARRTNKIVLLMLPVTQEVASSSLVGPAIFFSQIGIFAFFFFEFGDCAQLCAPLPTETVCEIASTSARLPMHSLMA
jgi:hypothetical protein